jgi:hypothetical protein
MPLIKIFRTPFSRGWYYQPGLKFPGYIKLWRKRGVVLPPSRLAAPPSASRRRHLTAPPSASRHRHLAAPPSCAAFKPRAAAIEPEHHRCCLLTQPRYRTTVPHRRAIDPAAARHNTLYLVNFFR